MGWFLMVMIIAIVITLISFIIDKVKNIAGKVTETPLMKAAIAEDVDRMNELLSSGVYMDETNVVKNTALSLSIIKNKEESAKLLINNGANLEMWYSDDKNIFDLALEGKNERILLFLIEKADAELLYRNYLLTGAATKNFGTKVLEKLLEKDKEGMYFKVRKKWTSPDIDVALLRAAFNGNIQNVDFLLKNGAKITTNPILSAVNGGSLPLVKKLIELGDDIEAKTDTGETSLVLAVINKNT
jgi:ankyrin repeat protein